jgi:hypothetical protein
MSSYEPGFSGYVFWLCLCQYSTAIPCYGMKIAMVGLVSAAGHIAFMGKVFLRVET